ncbi:MAG: PAS domain S-box protein [Deltaproteobacteria bacterium]|nr:PAS domain S-box protein [Deltaproteobacteria bacterium]
MQNNPLAATIDTLEIAIWELDLDLRILSYNRKAKEIYGDNVIGDFCFHAAAGLDHICPNCPAQKVLNGQPSGRSQHSRVTAIGKPITIDHTATPLKNEDGSLRGIVISIVDISHLKNIERELKIHQHHLEELVLKRTCELKESEFKHRLLYEKAKLQEELYHSILHSSSDAIVVYDTVGQVQYFNPTFSQIFGWNLEELKGRHIPFLPESEREISMQHISALINDGTPCQNFRTKRLTKQGELKDISISASRYIDHRDQPAGMLVILRDITDQIKAEQEALKVRKLESVGILAGGIAHDFNNILTAILGNISLALSLTEADSKTHKILAASEKASLRAKDLTQQLLTFAKGGEPLKEITSIEDIIRDSAGFVLAGKNVRCNFNFEPGLKPALIDPGQISQVIQNIIINAEQAMPAGGVIKIDCRNHRQEPQDQINKHDQTSLLEAGDYLRIRLKDQGCGIPAAIIDRIFDPYFTTKATGSGLGLAITHSIIRKHYGAITIDSSTDTGTTISIYLPAAASISSREPLPRPRRPEAEMSPGSVIIMDDEEIIREVVEGMLSAAGYKVLQAEDGQEALRLYENANRSDSPVTLIIMDLTIPGGMGGQQTAQKILQINPQAKIIVSSGYANDPIMADYAEYGFCAALAKPFQLQELKQTIAKALSS